MQKEHTAETTDPALERNTIQPTTDPGDDTTFGAVFTNSPGFSTCPNMEELHVKTVPKHTTSQK